MVTVTRGSAWQLGRHRLLCGDNRVQADVDRLLGGNKVDALLTDPPYCSGGYQEAHRSRGSKGTSGEYIPMASDMLSTRGYTKLLGAMLNTVSTVALAFIFTDWRMWVTLSDVVEAGGWGVRGMLVWDKLTPGMGTGFRSQHELIMMATKATPPWGRMKGHVAYGNVLACPRVPNVHHPTEKPVRLLSTILTVAAFAQHVYDPFAGSGATLLAADEMERTCSAMELDPQHCATIISRWQERGGSAVELDPAAVTPAAVRPHVQVADVPDVSVSQPTLAAVPESDRAP